MAQANVTNTLVVPEQSKVAPYFDDYTESKNFHRILFRPGYAVQARELTQVQTILQNQIERFGRHIFVNGSSVIGGKLDIADIVTLNISPEYANTVVNIANFKDKTIRLASGGGQNVLARVIQTSSGTLTAPPALHIKYMTGTEFSPGTIISTSDNVTASIISTSNASSNGTIAFLYDSIYFMQGYFVKVPAQATVLSKHNRVPTAKVGLELNEEFITESADTSLLDPALESSNFQAPGASRYKLTLNLSTRDINSVDDERFIQVARIENGIIKERVTTPIYSEIEEVLARRTYDESGNYIVKPFILSLEESITDSANNFVASISPGKAYLYGYETEIQSQLLFEVPRARDFLSRSAYNLNMNYGNYVLVDNLRGNFNTGMGIVDIHCVTSNLVNTANQQLYNSTKIGTTRLRDLEFFSGGANTAQRTFEFYFLDNKFTTLSSNAGALTIANNQIHLGNTALISTIDNAYTGSTIRITSGASVGDERQILTYNGATRVANVDINFTTPTGPTSNYTVRFDITDADSLYQSRNFTAGATSNAFATISLLSKDNGTYNGNTSIIEPTFTTGFFAYPKSYIRSVTNQSYTYRRTYNSIQFTSGDSSVITASTDEEFTGPTSSSNTSSAVMDNWLVIVTDRLSSSRNVGDQIPITTSVTTSTPEQATLSTGNTSDTFIATVYAKVSASLSGAAPRVKTLVLANTQTFTTEANTGPFVNATGSRTWVYPNSGQVVIQRPSDTTEESLYISDVIDAVKVFATPAFPNTGSTFANTAQDVTDRYVLDIGQKPGFYDHATIKLKPGFANPTDFITVCLRYYRNTNDVGYFSVDSYPSLTSTVIEQGIDIGTGYSLIPRVNGIKLSDAIDFRPVRPNASNTEFFNFSSVRTPVPITDFRSDYSYYLERWDIFSLTLDKKIERIQGISSENPSFPVEPEKSLLLHRMRMRPYTETLRDVFLNTVSHRRYTMKDISNIDRRLKNVEYSVSMSNLEKSADSILIKDVNGLNRTKFGILAESFTSHLLGDTQSSDYRCSIDLNKVITPKEGLMMPMLSSKEISLNIRKDTSRNISIHDDKVMLSYTTVPAITQATATKTTPVAEFLFADFRGSIMCSPEADIWKDQKVLPSTVVSIPPIFVNPNPGDPNLPNDSGPTNRLLLAQTNVLQAGSYIKDGNGVYQTSALSAQSLYSVTTAVADANRFTNYSIDFSSSQGKSAVDRVYDAYLANFNRPPDAQGLAYWASRTVDEKLTDIPGRLEAEMRFVGNVITKELSDINTIVQVNTTPSSTISDRSTVAAGGNIAVDPATSGALDYTAGNSGSVTRDVGPKSDLQGLYLSTFNREADPGGLAYWQGQIASGVSMEQVTAAFVNSAEYQSRPR